MNKRSAEFLTYSPWARSFTAVTVDTVLAFFIHRFVTPAARFKRRRGVAKFVLSGCRFPVLFGIVAVFFAAFTAPAQTTIQLTFNFEVAYAVENPVNHYDGSGTVDPFGSASFNGIESFTNFTEGTISIAITLAKGASFRSEEHTS